MIKPPTWIRLATYSILVAVLVMSNRRLGVIPVSLIDGDEAATYREAAVTLRANQKAFAAVGFKDAKRSGSELFEIVEATLMKNGLRQEGFGEPAVELRLSRGRLLWIIRNQELTGPFSYRIEIDDVSGNATFANTTAPM